MDGMRVMLAWFGLDDQIAAGLRAGRPERKPTPHLTWALTQPAAPADKVVLLDNQPPADRETWLNQLQPKITNGAEVEFAQVTLLDPTDYGGIHRAAVEVIEKVRKEHGPSAQLSFFLNSGTAPMGTVWVLLGKSQYPATLLGWSNERKRVEPVEVPFEIFSDYVRARTSESIRAASAERPRADAAFSSIIRGCAEMEELVVRAQRVAAHDVPVLIEGESGTGKELLATAIHNASPRRKYPLKPINCGAIPKGLLESELFGHAEGAFTGARTAKKGLFELADGGTLFLDEIGELDAELQVKLLRPLQEGVIQPVGAEPLRVDVRIIAATHRNLAAMVGAGTFREDLFYRLAVAVLNIPPLHQRGADLTLLADAQLHAINEEHARLGLPTRRLAADARNQLRKHRWPGNALEKSGGNKSEAARLLGLKSHQVVSNRLGKGTRRS
jgi:sigma54-dependent transcription regulator